MIVFAVVWPIISLELQATEEGLWHPQECIKGAPAPGGFNSQGFVLGRFESGSSACAARSLFRIQIVYN